MAASSREMNFLPRVIRLKDASCYLGMDKNRFNAEVRPYVTVIPIGKQGVGFDRLELDAWFEAYKAQYGRPAAGMKGGNVCQTNGRSRVLSCAGVSGTSKKGSGHKGFEKALERVMSKKRSNT